MGRSLKSLRLEIAPPDALVALLALHSEAMRATWPLSPRLKGALDAEVAKLTEALRVLRSCLEWFEELDLAIVRRPRECGAGRRAREQYPAYGFPATIDIDVAELVASLSEDGERAQLTASALCTVLWYLRENTLVRAIEVRTDGKRSNVETASVAFHRALEEIGFVVVEETQRSSRPTRRSPAGRAGDVETREPRMGSFDKNRARAARVRSTSSQSASFARKPPATPEAREHKRAARNAPPSPPHTKGGKARARVDSFGGLPDDAKPEDLRAPGAQMSPRGLSLDAEFFLEHAGIAHWPCTPAELERGRKHALARLHPDRQGEGAAALFHRAVRGHAELVARLAEASIQAGAGVSNSFTSAAPSVQYAARVSTPPASGASPLVGEWPPRRPASSPAERKATVTRRARAASA